MKQIGQWLLVAGIGMVGCTELLGQGRPTGRLDHARKGPPPFVSELPERYALLALADTDSNQKLEGDELKALAEAIADGVLKKPEWLPNPPKEVDVTPEKIAARLARFYEAFAVYDADQSGTLEDGEQEAIREAILSGRLSPPVLLIRGKERPAGNGRPGRPGGQGRRGRQR